MKKIGVLVHRLAVEYTATVVSGIYDYFKDIDDVSVFFAQTRQPNLLYDTHEFQYWASAELLKSKCIDALIIVSSSYLSSMHKEELQQIISQFDTNYIVSVGLDLELKNSYCAICKPYEVYNEIVEHLKNEHGCKKIGFFSSNLVHSQEGSERFDAYKQALKNNGFEFDEKLVLDGNYTMTNATEVLRSHFKTKEDVPFDAIICANDIMASAVVREMSTLGVRIPEELRIFGFDNTSHATMSNPSISTVDQQIELQGKTAAQMVYKILNKEEVKVQTEVPLKVIYRESCGCQNLDFILDNLLHSNVNYFSDITRIDILIDSISGVMSLDEFVHSFVNWKDTTGFDSFVCCLYDEPIQFSQEKGFVVPDSARLLINIDINKGIEDCLENGEVVNPRNQLFPEDLIGSKNYLFQPLFFGNVQYGYFCCKFNRLNFAANSVILQLLTYIVFQAYEYTMNLKNQLSLEEKYSRLVDNNSNLLKESYTDELTKLYNRRGYLKYAQTLVSFTSEMDTTGLVFFADLDGLKTINDTYGHKYGDLAIQTIAEVLRRAFRQSDIIGRLSGDEFSVVAPGMNFVNLEPIRRKIEGFCKELSKENNLPFTVSVSMGAVTFSKGQNDIQSLLREADAKLYEEKKVKHGKK